MLVMELFLNEINNLSISNLYRYSTKDISYFFILFELFLFTIHKILDLEYIEIER